MEPLGRYVVVLVPALTGATGSSVCLCVPQHYSIGDLKVALKRYLPSRDIELSDIFLFENLAEDPQNAKAEPLKTEWMLSSDRFPKERDTIRLRYHYWSEILYQLYGIPFHCDSGFRPVAY